MKNKTLTKILSAFLAVVMVLCAAPLSGFVGLKFPDIKLPDWNLFDFGVDAEAATYSGSCGITDDDNVYWSLDTETGVLNITGTGRMYNCYDTLWGVHLAPWSSLNSYIKMVNISDGVTSIGERVFLNCDSLTSITIPDSVTSIGNYAFYYCKSLTSVTIGDSVESIGNYAFSGCTSLTSVTIPDSVESIGSGAFSSCDGLTTVTIGNSVTSIGKSAFAGCSSLTSVTIGNSVTSIGSNAFLNCVSLTSIKVNSNNKNYDSDSYGVLYNKNKTELIQYPVGNGRKAFTIPDSVTSIGDYAFYSCNSLTSVTVGDSVTNIGNYAFYSCGSLTSAAIGDSVTNIGNYAFYYCKSLTSVTIPDSVTSIGDYAFWGCNSLTSVTIEDGVESIGYSAFYYCKSLTSVTIPDSVTSIGECAFCYCNSLTSVTIGDGVESIGHDAFNNCTSLTSVTIGDGVESIGDYAFLYCTSLVSVHYTGDIKSWCNISFDGCYATPMFYAKKFYLNNTLVKEIVISDTVTEIKDYAFYNFEVITSVTIGDSVESIGSYAFYNCTSLTTVTIGDSVTSIGERAFYNCTSLTSIKVDSNNKNYSSDSYGVLYNKNKATLIQYPIGNSRKTFTIPDSVTSIGSSAFRNCDSLTSVSIGDSVTSIGSDAFYNCDSLTSVTIPDSVTSIGSDAFYDCDSLTSVTIPDSVTGIGSYAFYNCDSLTSVTIPDSVTSIGSYAFEYCYSLTSVTIGDSVTIIGSYAFYYCTSLTDVYYTGTEAQWKKISIGSYNSPLTNATIHYNSSMPEGKLNYSQKHTVSDYASKNAKYENAYFGGEAIALDGTDGTADLCIPGLSKNDNLVPQGIAYYEAKNWMLVSAYYKEESGNMCDVSSVIFALDMDTGKMVGEFRIKNANGSAYTEHAGGIAVSDYNLYITDKNSTISYVPLSALDSSKNEIKIEKSYSCSEVLGGANTSYLSYNDGILWTGNFYEKNDFKKPASSTNNSVVLGYKLTGASSDEEWYNLKNSSSWSYKFNIPNSISKIQGVSVKNSKLYLLSSYGRKYDSTLYIADVEMGSRHVSEASMIKVNALPMLEGMCLTGNYIYTLSESAAWYYNGYDSDNVSKNPTDVVWRINYKALIGEDHVTSVSGDVEKISVSFVQGSGADAVTGSVDVSFKQNWFKEDSINYNHNIARLASQYAMIGYDEPTSLTEKPYLRTALKTIGMDDIEIIGQASRDQVNYFIASRKITVDSKRYDLIFVGLIGSYHEQWYSNFDPGTDAVHQGFLSAKQFVYSALTQYIKDKGFSKDTTKILITGHSRGAAASNLLAADLIKGGVYAKPENIYTYAFATPNSTTLPERTDAKFNRIYNIVNPEDFVTKCMPVSWGYGRYGQTLVLPSKTNEKNSDYNVYKSNMQMYFSRFTNGKTYTPYPGAEADTRFVVASLTSTVRSVNQFYNKTLVAGVVPMSTYTFFQNSLCHFVSKVASTGDIVTAGSLLAATLLSTSSNVYQSIVAYFFVDQIVNPCFENAHQAETYCAYMMSMTESQIKEKRKGYLNTVNCPVDVTVIDNETGEIVGRIVNNIIDEEIAAKENSVVMTVDGDSKCFWLPSDGDYEVILTGNDNGTMDYSVSEVDSDLGETERVNFFDVEIKDGDSYTGEIISDDFDVEEYTITSENGEVISPDEKLDDSSMQSVEINVTVSGNGYATDSMTVTKGDYVSLSATPEDGYKFDGWYENGKLVSKEKSYSFVAKEEHIFVARFSKNKPSVITTIVTDYKHGFTINKYLDLPENSGYEITYESSDPTVATVDKDGNITTVGRGITLITSTIVYENGETETQLKNVEVVYTWWQWLIIIFLFGWIWY